MWKFGLLGRDFGYRKFYRYPNNHDCWISATQGEKDHPHFGDVAEIYNVIDARQSEAQNTVIEALRGLGHGEAADHYTHFSYEMVALTPRCAAELGYTLSEEDKARSYIEVSGRKGFGVKADDLLDQLIASAKKEVDSRHPQVERSRAPANCHSDRHRRLALLHAEVHEAVGDRIRFQGSAQLRGRDRTLRAIRRRPRDQHFPKSGSRSRNVLQQTLRPLDLAKDLAGEAPTKSGNSGSPHPRLPT